MLVNSVKFSVGNVLIKLTYVERNWV